MNINALTFLLQVSDGNFPNGAFSHSFGLENLIEDGDIFDAPTFRCYLEDWFFLQVVPFEGLLTHLAWERALHADIHGLITLSEFASRSVLPELSRAGVLRIGQRTLQVLSTMLPDGVTSRFCEVLRQGKGSTLFSIALAVAAAELGVGQSEVVAVSLYTSVSMMVATAVRAVPLGQSEGQHMLRTCRQWIADTPSFAGMGMFDLSSSAVPWEIAQMNHKFLDGKLFMS